MNIVELLANIKLSKVLDTLELCDELRNQQKWIFILDCYHIEVFVILH